MNKNNNDNRNTNNDNNKCILEKRETVRLLLCRL